MDIKKKPFPLLRQTMRIVKGCRKGYDDVFRINLSNLNNKTYPKNSLQFIFKWFTTRLSYDLKIMILSSPIF